ncbi:hypothetical protein MRB53_004677 [Persea americana]|uniref:Uncharacterized protein n=1 Tax=Persea americana TaxID=3435 RepID=A0ACC2MC56_PERAE|nr:hypothetical protein MRB53_004677 [Persea americana]
MHSHVLFSSLFLIIFLTISLSQGDSNEEYQICAPSKFDCGSFKSISYPFWVKDRPLNCSYPGFNLTCNDNSTEIKIGSKTYQVKAIDYVNQVVTIVDTYVIGEKCRPLASSWTLNFSLFAYTRNDYNLTIYNCPYEGQEPNLHVLPCPSNGSNYSYYKVDNSSILFMPDYYLFGYCTVSVFTILDSSVANLGENLTNFGGAMKEGFNVSWVVDSGKCRDCVISGGNCGHNANQPDQPVCYCSGEVYQGTCPLPSKNNRRIVRKVIVGISAATGSCLITAAIAYLWYRKKQLTSSSSKLISRTISSDPSSRELGEGGFGTVYHGKLLDGRSVAVKRLYEHNFRRVEQFKNEIEIISRLRHRNLVSLYGCTSRHSRELLLVFGVVLFELISSKPAVDITRHRHDINLSNMAINKIHNNALHELVDPSFEFESNSEVRRRITLVAELAYRCLHDEKEMRPSMEEVLMVLREVESDKYKADKGKDIDVLADDVVLLKKMTPSSPDTVTAPWISRNTTPNTSGSG